MKSFSKKIIFLFICLMPLALSAQQATDAPKEKSPASSRLQRKTAKKKWKEQRKLEHDQQKAVKEHHKRLQTKKTLKRMKNNKNKSDGFRENKKEFFLVRWFKYKKH